MQIHLSLLLESQLFNDHIMINLFILYILQLTDIVIGNRIWIHSIFLKCPRSYYNLRVIISPIHFKTLYAIESNDTALLDHILLFNYY